ncbi:hypothetical protein PTSG_05876 [Salpingoeca rosetta]|uniref:Palmitoyltransferase n=1 Tax=Salpingoeca rosetta (strain ATCC 50818 / BSB-021) TaxID=946362 RepID=F2UD17_SALR5|nr:uncharacterized protein PTSG_05876 [Salpingoeca rosetta]EGD74512.1 hypothetical protein PTSG_05876 [Salpingoeca rosetta]|eukprot:XP_004992769.1 hypothetical protein PTSG_05876 [Salpingoeca rosetta]
MNSAMLSRGSGGGGGRYRKVVDPINPFNDDASFDRLPGYMFLLGPIICVVITLSALAHLWYAAVLHPFVAVTAEERETNIHASMVATIFVVLQSWAIYATYTARIIPLPAESSLYSGTKSLTDLRNTDIITLESVATYCKHCNRYRPVSAHHCRLCKGCSLDFDHHCPALGNCIGLHNYKQFLLVIIYSWLAVLLAFLVLLSMGHVGTVIGTIFPMTTSLQAMAERQLRQPSFFELIFFAWGVFLSASTSVAFLMFVGIHCRLIMQGKTTLQMLVGEKDVRHKAPMSYDEEMEAKMTPFERIQLVFGRDLWQMGLPIVRASDLRYRFQRSIRPLEVREPPSRIV